MEPLTSCCTPWLLQRSSEAARTKPTRDRASPIYRMFPRRRLLFSICRVCGSLRERRLHPAVTVVRSFSGESIRRRFSKVLPVPRMVTEPKSKIRPNSVWSTSTLSTFARFISIVARRMKPRFRITRRSVDGDFGRQATKPRGNKSADGGYGGDGGEEPEELFGFGMADAADQSCGRASAEQDRRRVNGGTYACAVTDVFAGLEDAIDIVHWRPFTGCGGYFRGKKGEGAERPTPAGADAGRF